MSVNASRVGQWLSQWHLAWAMHVSLREVKLALCGGQNQVCGPRRGWLLPGASHSTIHPFIHPSILQALTVYMWTGPCGLGEGDTPGQRDLCEQPS